MQSMTGGYWLKVSLDLLLLWVAALLAWYLRYKAQLFRVVEPSFYQPASAYFGLFSLLAIAYLVAAYANGVYQRVRGQLFLDEMVRIGNSVTISIVLLMATTFGLQPLAFSRLLFLYCAVLVMVFLALSRVVWRSVLAYFRARGRFVDRVLVVGGGETGRAVMRTLAAQPNLGYAVVGYLSETPEGNGSDMGRIRLLGGLMHLNDVLNREQIDDVIVALPWSQQEAIRQVTRICLNRGIRPQIVPDIFQLNVNRVDVNMLGSLPLLGIKDQTISRGGQIVKRLIDIALTLLLMLAGLLPFLIIGLLIKLDSPGPVLFTQTRIGLRGRAFKVYKFRTMVMDAEDRKAELLAYNEASGPLFKMRNDPRRTRVGRWLRMFSVDEFPQLINVLRGEMSLIGPRPGLPEEIEQYEPWQMQRLEIRPGITGLSQVSGRSELSFDETCLLDIYYIENWSLSLDLTILLRTIPFVLSARGAY